MDGFFDALIAFGSAKTIWVYLFIFFGKIAEVAVSTLRLVLINRGERLTGSLIAVLENLLWLIVTGSVLVGYQEDFIKVVVFCVAFAVGNYLGSWLEERLAFGLCSVQAIVMTQDDSYKLTKTLRANGYGVSEMQIEGLDDKHYMLLITIKRKLQNEVLDLISATVPDVMVTVSDIKTQKGGYLRAASTRRARRLTK